MSEDISPSSQPFDRYVSGPAPDFMEGPARRALHYVALAKRILLQERVQNFTGADVVALAAIIERASTKGRAE